MSFDVVNNIAVMNGKDGIYGAKARGANYGRNAALNYESYIKELAVEISSVDFDVFTKSHSPEEMMKELEKFEQTETLPANLFLRYAPKMGPVKAFLARLFKGAAIDKQALLGYTYETMNKMRYQDLTIIENAHNKDHEMTQEIIEETIEEADLPFKEEAFADDPKLTSRAFDVNDDGKIDISEEAVSTVIADILSKDENLDPMDITVSDLKKADGSCTNDGENSMMAFFKEENLETASNIVKDIHAKLKLDKAMNKFLKKI